MKNLGYILFCGAMIGGVLGYLGVSIVDNPVKFIVLDVILLGLIAFKPNE